MIHGETVEVWAMSETGRDSLNNPVVSWALEATVSNVLVAPASTVDVVGSIRRDGDEVILVLHFPKSYQAPLRGRRVRVRGVDYQVVGDPVSYQPDLTPGAWNRPVNVGLIEG